MREVGGGIAYYVVIGNTRYVYIWVYFEQHVNIGLSEIHGMQVCTTHSIH